MTNFAQKQPLLLRPVVSNLWLLALPLCLALSACKKIVPEAEKPIVTVQAAHPEMGVITDEIEGDATLAPVAQAAIQSKVSAPIRQFFVQRGSHVSAGQIVARLENRDLAAAALDNKGNYTAAEGTYMQATQATMPQEETQAREDRKQAQSQLILNQGILTARQKLFAEGAIPGRDVDTARSIMVQSQAAYDIARQKFETLARVGKKASLTTAQGNLESAKGKYLGAEAQLSYTSIRTPIKGVVTDRPFFAGETPPAGTAILTIMDTSTMIAKIHIAQSQAQQLAIGGEAMLAVPGMAEPVPAKVSLVSPALDTGSTTVEVWLKAQNPDGKLKAGSAVRATLKGRTLQGLLIPTDAVQRSSEGAGKIVMVIAADGTAHKRNVTLGIETPEKTQVLEGLNAGDTVITGGGVGLDDGSKVKIGPAEEKAGEGDAADKLGSADKKPGAKD